MNKFLYLAILASLSFNICAHDFSGTYDCVGKDAHEGEYKGQVIMKLKPDLSPKGYQSYDFTLKVPEYGDYHGFAAVKGMDAGIYFGLEDKTNNDYGVGVAKFSQNKNKQWTFHKFYFEPGYKGGNTGIEDCVQQK